MTTTTPLDDDLIKTRRTVFLMSCIALTVTAMTFAIRAGILSQLSSEFMLSNTQLGWINGMAFFGFPAAMIVGGFLYNGLGPKFLMVAAFGGHLVGLLMTMMASGFWTLIVSTFLVGFANGAVEAACNPMIADAYKDRRVVMLNRFHVWFPGGIVIGALTSQFLTGLSLGWQTQIASMMLPTLAYGTLLFTLDWDTVPRTKLAVSTNLRALASPLFVFLAFAMTLTATTELGTQQWIERILGASGAQPMLILAMITGLMAVGRYCAGPVVTALNPAGVLLASAILSALGIFLMSQSTGGMVYPAAIVFALGVTYFWPTMIGFVGEYQPRTGALGMSLVGGAGVFATGLWSPVIGGWIDGATKTATSAGLTGDAASLAAGQAVLERIVVFPIALVVIFVILVVVERRSGRAGQD